MSATGHDAAQDALGQAGVASHRLPFVGVELAWLVEDQVGHAELADVVQQSGATQGAQVVTVAPHKRGDGHGDLGDALGVARGVGRLGVDDAGERLGDGVQALVVGHGDAVGRLHAGHVGPAQGGPERAVVLDDVQRVDESGVEPRAAARSRHGQRRVGPVLGPEDLHRLGQAHDASEQADLLAGHAIGIASPVPVLVELSDGAGRCLVEVDHAGDVGPALTAQCGQGARADRAVADQSAELARLDGQRSAGCSVAPQVAQRLGRAQVVGRLAVALDCGVVVAIEGGDLGRVGRAAGVLEQQRVEE